MHREGKIHRDVKAANVLLSSTGKVKLADLGVAAQLSNLKSQRNTLVGTPFWMAPEVIQQAGHDFKADIWSLGVTAIELVNGEPPHANTHPMKALFLIPKAPAPRLEGNQYSRDFRDFVASCLVKDPDRRPLAKEMLGHRFIRGAGRIEALQELIERRQRWERSGDGSSHPRYYEETMFVHPFANCRGRILQVRAIADGLRKSMAPKTESDDWIFDTVKGPAVSTRKPSQKRRKISATYDHTLIYTEEALGQLQITANTSQGPPQHQPTTVRKVSQPRQSVAAEARAPSRRVSAARRPLGPDLSFGNGASTVRQFRRVSDNSPTTSPDGTLASRDENHVPQKDVVTKEAKLGRKAYSAAIDLAFQETHAQTSSQVKREALARVASAWEALDLIDPDGEYQLLRSMMSKLQG